MAARLQTAKDALYVSHAVVEGLTGLHMIVAPRQLFPVAFSDGTAEVEMVLRSIGAFHLVLVILYLKHLGPIRTVQSGRLVAALFTLQHLSSLAIVWHSYVFGGARDWGQLSMLLHAIWGFGMMYAVGARELAIGLLKPLRHR